LIKDRTLNGIYDGSYFDISPNEMRELISYAPIAVMLYVNTAFISYKSGVFSGCPDYNTSIRKLNHAVLLVGYDEKGNYIAKNQWGGEWGEKGYIKISKKRDCGASYVPRGIRGLNKQLEERKVGGGSG
jgi:cathepsin L